MFFPCLWVQQASLSWARWGYPGLLCCSLWRQEEQFYEKDSDGPSLSGCTVRSGEHTIIWMDQWVLLTNPLISSPAHFCRRTTFYCCLFSPVVFPSIKYTHQHWPLMCTPLGCSFTVLMCCMLLGVFPKVRRKLLLIPSAELNQACSLQEVLLSFGGVDLAVTMCLHNTKNAKSFTVATLSGDI